MNNHDISDGTKKLVKLGLASKGAVYSLIGILAFLTVIGGSSGQTTGKQGIIKWLMEQSYGPVIVAIIAIGLLFYAIWRIVRAVKSNKDDAKDIVKRLGIAGGGILYGVLAVYAAKLAFEGIAGSSGGSGGGEGSQQQVIQEILQQSWGQYVIIAFGIIIILRSLYLGWMALSGKYKEKVQGYGINENYQGYLIKSGKLGYIARGIVFIVIGYFFIKSGIESDASTASQGTGAAMEYIQGAGGTVLMLVVALGLICYGIFMFLQAKYRNIESVI